MPRRMTKQQRQAYSEGYRLGLYAGGKLARIGFELAEPDEAKEEEGGKHAGIQSDWPHR